MSRWRALLDLYQVSRRVGHTTVAARAAVSVGGVLICASWQEARTIAREHNVATTAYDFAERLRGGPPRVLIPDNHLMAVLLRDVVQAQDDRDQLMRNLEVAQLRIGELVYQLIAKEMLAVLVEREAQWRGGLRALANIGLAIHMGMLLVHVARDLFVAGHGDPWPAAEPRNASSFAQARAALKAAVEGT